MLTLYHGAISTCSQKVRIALAEKSLDWHSQHISLNADEQLQPDYLKLNPNGVVPTLIHDGTVLLESTVINEYLADAFTQGADLLPAKPLQRAKMRLWTKRLDEGLHAAINTVSFVTFLRQQYLDAGKSDADMAQRFASLPDRNKRQRQQLLWQQGLEAPQFAEALEQWQKVIDDMEQALSGQQWLAGDDYSLADIAYTPYLLRLQMLQFAPWWEQNRPNVSRWWQAAQARPSFGVAVDGWLNDNLRQLLVQTGIKAWEKAQSLL